MHWIMPGLMFVTKLRWNCQCDRLEYLKRGGCLRRGTRILAVVRAWQGHGLCAIFDANRADFFKNSKRRKAGG